MSKIFVPSMQKQGYPKSIAGAVTATSATLEIIIPSSIPMVLYGVTSNVSIKDLFIAGIVPGIILGGAFMVTSYIFARRENHPVDERFELIRLGVQLRRAGVPLIIPVIVVGEFDWGLCYANRSRGRGRGCRVGLWLALAA